MGRKENTVEAYLQQRVRELGGFTRKIVYQGRAGAPDQWCFFPKGRLLIVECKAADGIVAPIQRAEINTLRISGFEACVVYTKDEIDVLLRKCL